ncbi:uncharacterized protein SPSC_04672 [Sporisorium scitamineum]|uniref:Uncharacterized protein n=1 Tax=Sporisorium scitamineum TaxID=49012 RepID=A0A127ZFE5_9BASI|nr:uncharacterized protein SPSC_04672 [Sporisorium scitamineum]
MNLSNLQRASSGPPAGLQRASSGPPAGDNEAAHSRHCFATSLSPAPLSVADSVVRRRDLEEWKRFSGTPALSWDIEALRTIAVHTFSPKDSSPSRSFRLPTLKPKRCLRLFFYIFQLNMKSFSALLATISIATCIGVASATNYADICIGQGPPQTKSFLALCVKSNDGKIWQVEKPEDVGLYYFSQDTTQFAIVFLSPRATVEFNTDVRTVSIYARPDGCFDYRFTAIISDPSIGDYKKDCDIHKVFYIPR